MTTSAPSWRIIIVRGADIGGAIPAVSRTEIWRMRTGTRHIWHRYTITTGRTRRWGDRSYDRDGSRGPRAGNRALSPNDRHRRSSPDCREGEQAAAALAEVVAGENVIAFVGAELGSRHDLSRIVMSARRNGDGWRLDGAKSIVTAALWSDRLLGCARSAGQTGDRLGLSLFLMDRCTPRLRSHAYPTIDDRHAADLIFHVGVPRHALIGEDGEALPVVEELTDRAIAAACAEGVRAMRRTFVNARSYPSPRRQFKRPLADFQVLQYRMVGMLMKIEMAIAATCRATFSVDKPAAQRAMAASSATVTNDKALYFVERNALQLHGGMGTTDELLIGCYFRRGTVIEAEFGEVDYHPARYSALSHQTFAMGG